MNNDSNKQPHQPIVYSFARACLYAALCAMSLHALAFVFGLISCDIFKNCSGQYDFLLILLGMAVCFVFIWATGRMISRTAPQKLISLFKYSFLPAFVLFIIMMAPGMSALWLPDKPLKYDLIIYASATSLATFLFLPIAVAAFVNPSSTARDPKEIKLFLASSNELKEDRDDFDLFFRQLNDSLRDRGFYLKIERWETFFDGISPTRKQDEYNEKVRNCDVFVCLFFNRIGQFTKEEFEAAYEHFHKCRKPIIFTYFKSPTDSTISNEGTEKLEDFKKWLSTVINHYPSHYNNIDDLKLQFRHQLDMLIENKTFEKYPFV